MPSTTTTSAPSPPVIQTAASTLAATGTMAAAINCRTFRRLNTRWLAVLLRSYQSTWSSKRSQVGPDGWLATPALVSAGVDALSGDTCRGRFTELASLLVA
jgi:hypothetical protein